MAESSLSVTRSDLLRAIGRFVGWGREPNKWQEDQKSDARDIIQRGLRQFYNPPILPGESNAHRWSFLRPIMDLTTVGGQGDYELPDDFGGLDSPLCFSGTEIGFGEISKASDQQILQMRQAQNTLTGFPRCYGLAVQPSNGDEPTRYTLLLYPTPQSVYALKLAYRSNPYDLSESRPYPLGGQPCAQALVSSVIAAAAEIINDEYNGPALETFLLHLRSAVSHDRQEIGARILGFNGDPSQGTSWMPRRALAVTFNDQAYQHEGYYFGS